MLVVYFEDILFAVQGIWKSQNLRRIAIQVHVFAEPSFSTSSIRMTDCMGIYVLLTS